jgi:trehalose 6-phosphate phosphatase
LGVGCVSLPSPPDLDAEHTSLFLDIDGTLANFERLPEEVGPTPRRTALLKGLSVRLQGRVAMITGRALADMDRITAGAVIAGSGVHGLEHRHADGRVETAAVHPGIDQARKAFQALLQQHSRLVLEDKGLGLVLHYRAAPDLERVAHEAAEQAAAETGLALQRGEMMAEVKTPGRTKGDALRTFMAADPFAGHTPVYIGDDLTDEHAFQAARDLGGYGVLVGPERATAASYRLHDVEAVLAWLETLAGGLSPAAEAFR